MDLAQRLKSLMKLKQITQVEMAEKTGFTQSYISAVCNGKKISIENLSAFCSCLDISLSEFFRPFAEAESLPSYIEPVLETCKNLKTKEDAATILAVASRLVAYSSVPGVQESLASVELASSADEDGEGEDEEPKFYLPLLGGAAAGSPIYRPADDGDLVAVPEEYDNPDRFAVFQARGDSMEPRIPDGAFIIVELDAWPADGEVAVVMLDGFSDAEYVVKRVYSRKDKIVLCSYNKAYNDKVIDAEEVRLAYRMVCMIPND